MALVVTSRWWMFPSRRLAFAFSMGWALVVGGSILLTGYLLQPSYPETIFHGQWTPNLGHLEWYRGKVLDARVGSRFIRSWKLEHSDSVRADLLRGAPIEVLALAGPEVPGLAALFSIAGEPKKNIILIGPNREDLVYRYRMRAADFRLAQPDLRIKGAMALAEGDSVSIKVWHNDNRYCITVNGRTSCELRFTLGTGWRFLGSAERIPSSMQAGFSILWMAMLLAPFGFWFRTTPSVAAGASLTIAVLVLSPGITGILSTPLVEWVGGGIGLGIGAVLGAWARASMLTDVNEREDLTGVHFCGGTPHRLENEM